MSYNSFSNNNTGPSQYALLQFRKTNSFTTVLTGDTLARIEFSGYNATASFLLASSIGCRVTGVPAANIPSELLFYSSTGLATNISMVIGQNGNVAITPFSGIGLTVSGGETISTGNLNFASTAQRITGDMSNGTYVNRLAFQSSTVNGNSSLFVLPNGTGASSSALCSNASDPTNSAFAQMQIDAASVKLISSVLGTGTQLPMEIRIGATAAINISTNRAVSIANTIAGNTPLTITGTNTGGILVNQSTSGAPGLELYQSSADGEPAYLNMFKNRSGGNINAGDNLSNIRFFGFQTGNQVAGQIRCYAETVGAARASGALDFFTTSTAGALSQRLYIGSDGNVVINAPSTTALTALTISGANLAGTYAQLTNASINGGVFNANRCLNNTGAAGSSCYIEVAVALQTAATGGDAAIRFVNYGVGGFLVGLDTSANQFSMSAGDLGDANTFFAYDIATSQLNLPRQCAWSYSAAAQNNVTGAGGIYTVAFANIDYNVGVTVNAAFTTFTMPKTGKYLINIQIVANGIAVGMTLGYFELYKNGGPFRSYSYVNPFVCQSGGLFFFSGTSLLSLTTGDVLSVIFYINGGAGNTVGIPATTSAYISGQLLS